MKFDLIVSDPCWKFSDSLSMSSVKRGASANYAVLDIEAIKQLKVSELAADAAVLALWVPSSLLQEGLDTMKAWGFRQTQTHVWVKIKNKPFIKLFKKFVSNHNNAMPDVFTKGISVKGVGSVIKQIIKLLTFDLEFFNFDEILAFGMGRLFRQTHEICLLGVKGKVYDGLTNKSQRSVHFDINKKHSAKPEILQDRLELMFPKSKGKRLEMFGRRSRQGWVVIGDESPETLGQDIRESIDKLIEK